MVTQVKEYVNSFRKRIDDLPKNDLWQIKCFFEKEISNILYTNYSSREKIDMISFIEGQIQIQLNNALKNNEIISINERISWIQDLKIEIQEKKKILKNKKFEEMKASIQTNVSYKNLLKVLVLLTTQLQKTDEKEEKKQLKEMCTHAIRRLIDIYTPQATKNDFEKLFELWKKYLKQEESLTGDPYPYYKMFEEKFLGIFKKITL